MTRTTYLVAPIPVPEQVKTGGNHHSYQGSFTMPTPLPPMLYFNNNNNNNNNNHQPTPPSSSSPRSSTFRYNVPRRRRTLTLPQHNEQHLMSPSTIPSYASIEHHLDEMSEVEKAHSTTKRTIKWFVPFGIITSLLLLLFITSRPPNTEHPKTKYYQYVPFLWQTRVENYNFKTRALEQQCYDGSITRYNNPSATQSIPKVVHFTWGLKGDGAFTFPFYLAIRAALHSIQPNEIRVHYTNLDRNNQFFRALEPNITMVYHDPEQYLAASGFEKNIDIRNWHVAHVADVLRLHILKEEGGIYLDSDAYALHSFDTLLHGARDVIMGHEGGNRYGMANAVIAAKQNATFINRWMEKYAATFNPHDWNGHSVVLPKRLAQRHPKEICVLSPTAFFWPLWTESHVEFMHTPLSRKEAREIEDRIERNDGRLYDDQLVYHAWSQNSMDKYVRHLTPDTIRSEDTRFNILMRRFLD